MSVWFGVFRLGGSLALPRVCVGVVWGFSARREPRPPEVCVGVVWGFSARQEPRPPEGSVLRGKNIETQIFDGKTSKSPCFLGVGTGIRFASV